MSSIYDDVYPETRFLGLEGCQSALGAVQKNIAMFLWQFAARSFA